MFLIFLIAVFMFSMTHVVFYMMRAPKSKRVTNLVKVYILGVEAWNALYVLHNSFFQVLLWNNTLPMWGLEDSLSAYEIQNDYYKNKIIKNYTESTSYDLGNYTEYYVKTLTTVSLFELNYRGILAKQSICSMKRIKFRINIVTNITMVYLTRITSTL